MFRFAGDGAHDGTVLLVGMPSDSSSRDGTGTVPLSSRAGGLRDLVLLFVAAVPREGGAGQGDYAGQGPHQAVAEHLDPGGE